MEWVEPLSGELKRGSGNIDGRSLAGAPGRGSHRTEGGGDVCGAQGLGRGSVSGCWDGPGDGWVRGVGEELPIPRERAVVVPCLDPEPKINSERGVFFLSPKGKKYLPLNLSVSACQFSSRLVLPIECWLLPILSMAV